MTPRQPCATILAGSAARLAGGALDIRADATEKKTQEDEGSGKPSVLLVEDEPTLTKLVGALLDEAGYQYRSIADHKLIGPAIARWKPQCVILDSDPGSPGHKRSWADAAAIRRAHPDVPVLMFTADPASMAEARAGVSARSIAAGYAGVIDKPFLVVEFLATLKHAVDTPAERLNDGKGIAKEAITIFPDLGGEASAEWAAADFISMAVHELRTPLTSLDGHAQLAQRFMTKDPVRVSDALVRIREQTKRMNRVIGDLLDYTRVSAGALSLEVVTFDLGVATAITIGLHEYEETARITYTRPGPVRVQGDPERIAQILSNLLDNAIKYSLPGSPIEVSLTVAGPEARIRVTDHGLGVPDDERGRLFAPFFRTSRTREIAGTGLGLHISRRLAEQHHGRLWLESSDEASTVFVLALPLAAQEPSAAP